MSYADLAKTIEAAFEDRNNIGPSTKGAVRDAVDDGARTCSTRGKARVAEKSRQDGRAGS